MNRVKTKQKKTKPQHFQLLFDTPSSPRHVLSTVLAPRICSEQMGQVPPELSLPGGKTGGDGAEPLARSGGASDPRGLCHPGRGAVTYVFPRRHPTPCCFCRLTWRGHHPATRSPSTCCPLGPSLSACPSAVVWAPARSQRFQGGRVGSCVSRCSTRGLRERRALWNGPDPENRCVPFSPALWASTC